MNVTNIVRLVALLLLAGIQYARVQPWFPEEISGVLIDAISGVIILIGGVTLDPRAMRAGAGKLKR